MAIACGAFGREATDSVLSGTESAAGNAPHSRHIWTLQRCHRSRNAQQQKTPCTSTPHPKPLAPSITFPTPISLPPQQKNSQVIPASAEKVPEAVGTAKRDWTPPA